MKNEINNNKKERSELSLEEGVQPFSIYTRRVFKYQKLNEFLDENSSKGLCGTENLGNTCYMNSVLTSLINCNELIYYFLKEDYKKDINKENNAIPEMFNELIKKYWLEKTDMVIPISFRDKISEKNPLFKGMKQQDSNEFLTSTLDLLNEGLRAEINIEEKFEINNIENKTDEESAKIFWDHFLKLNDSVITDLFTGQFKQILICPECGKYRRTFEFFNILNLPIPKNEKNYIFNFQFIYVPRHGIRRPVRIFYRKYRNDVTFIECLSKLKTEDKFIYKNKIDKLVINKIYNKISQGFINGSMTLDEMNKERTFYFCYDLIEGKNIEIPIYLKEEGGPLSDYPRMLFFSEEETLEDLRLKIYCIIRKYFYVPIKGEGISNDQLTLNIIKYIKNKEIEDEEILDSIKEEYDSLIEGDSTSDNIFDFINNLPFKIYLFNKQNKKEKIPFLTNFVDFSDEVKTKLNINDFSKKFLSLLDTFEKYSIIIEFNPNSEYINKYNFNLNICTRCNLSYEEVEDINDKKFSIDDCFRNLVKEEKLRKSEEWECPNCQKKVLAKKKTELYYLPKIFIICFSRFIKENDYWSKNQEEILFPINNLDMKDYMIGPDKEHSKYDLLAIIQHYGTIENGHYTSVCKNENNWYKYDDSSVNETNVKEAENSNAYILFYRRQTD